MEVINYINLNILECKFENILQLNICFPHINLNILECKLIYKICFKVYIIYNINLNILECKFFQRIQAFPFCLILI